MKQNNKTNAMRILDRFQLNYRIHTYEHHEKDPVDGIHVAEQLNEDPCRVFKTLLMRSATKAIYVFVLPVNEECDLKKCARCVQEKNMEMIHVKEIQAVSGYIRGGCSPIGMKKHYPTVFHSSCLFYDTIYFSGGKIGYQIEMNPQEAISLLQATTADIIKKPS